MSDSRTGKIPGTSSTVELSFDRAIGAVDDLIAPDRTEEIYLAPGFIDAQVNGFAGVDYNDPDSSHESIARSIQAMFSTGVTRLFATMITGSHERILGALANMTRAKRQFETAGLPEGDAIEAFHIEGPHISPEDGPRGAHPREFVRPPDIEELKRWQEAAEGLIRLVTISPEWPTAPAYIEEAVRMGIVVSVGHTKATSEQIGVAVSAGATMSTHLGNGSHSVLHKSNNYIWDQLADERLTPSFIVDGIHIPEHFLKACIRAKGVEHSVLVTDAVMPALCKPGHYRLGSVDVELLEGNKVVLEGGDRLAGSALRMDDAIGNTVRMAGISLRSALSMATVNVARVCRVPGRQRGLAPGEKADIVRFRWDEQASRLTVVETIVSGQSAYSLEPSA